LFLVGRIQIIENYAETRDGDRVEGHVAHLEIASIANLMSDIRRNVPRPTFGGIESDDANRVAELALQHPYDDSLKVRPLEVGFAIGAADRSKVIHNDVGGVIVVTRHDQWCPAGIPHRNSPRNRTGNSIKSATNRSSGRGKF
jgi:hypothetical protein